MLIHQKRLKWLSWMIAFGASLYNLASATTEPTETITIDPSTNYGSWQGWGTSLAWFGKIYGDREDIADLLFTTKKTDLQGHELPGLGMTIVRYNAGACSWNEVDGERMVVSKIIRPFRQMEGYWLDGKSVDPRSSSWDWSVDQNQRSILLNAKKRGATHFELFSNSPMWWMCTNNNPSGHADRRTDNLPPENYQAFASYLATIAAQAKSHWGIEFTSIEPFNESTSGYWFADCKQEGAQFNIPTQVKFLPILREELDRQGLQSLPIVASDETSYDAALKVWRAYPPEIKDLVARVNVHGYQGAKGNRTGLYEAVTVDAHKPIWNSEYGDKHADGMDMARNLHRDMNSLHPTAWCYWQPLDGGNDSGWGMIQANLDEGSIGQANPKYFVFAQYSRHIRPGMVILESGHANTIAAYDPFNKQLVIASLNDGPASDHVYDLSNFKTQRSTRVHGFITEPLGNSRYRPLSRLRLSDSTLAVPFPANSIQTIIISNIVF